MKKPKKKLKVQKTKMVHYQVIHCNRNKPLTVSEEIAAITRSHAAKMASKALYAQKKFKGDGEYAEFGGYLANLRTTKAWKLLVDDNGLPFPRFVDYCKVAYDISEPDVSKLTGAARVVKVLVAAGIEAPRTLDQTGPYRPLKDEDIIRTARVTIERVGHNQPSSTELTKTAVELKLRKPPKQDEPEKPKTTGTEPEKTSEIAALFEKIDEAMKAQPPGAPLATHVAKLRALVLPQKLAESASGADGDRIGESGISDPVPPIPVLSQPRDTAAPPPPTESFPIPSYNGTFGDVWGAIQEPVAPYAMKKYVEYSLGIVGRKVWVRFQSPMTNAMLKASVEKWGETYRYEPSEQKWYSKMDYNLVDAKKLANEMDRAFQAILKNRTNQAA